jgi:hypothetical protein
MELDKIILRVMRIVKKKQLKGTVEAAERLALPSVKPHYEDILVKVLWCLCKKR